MRKYAAAFILAAVTALTGCNSGGSAENEIKLPIYGADEIRFEIARAQYMDISETRSVGATIGYPYATYIEYPGDALVKTWNAVKGREVKEGDILAELDSSALDYEINNQQTQVNAAYAASLSGGQAAVLQYQIEQYKLDMMLAEKDKYTIRAPYDGIVTYLNRVNENSYAEGGKVCVGVSEVDRVCVYVEGNDASAFRFGQNVRVKISDSYYDAVVVQAPDCAPSDATGNSANRAVFDLGEGVLDKIREEDPMGFNAGWATAYVTTEKKNVLAVPNASVKTSGSTSYVTIVDGDERFKLYVTAGVSLGGYTEIINGIAEGDIVMAEGSGVYSSVGEINGDDAGNAGGADWIYDGWRENS